MSEAIFLIENPPTQPSESRGSTPTEALSGSLAKATDSLAPSNLLPAEVAEALVMLDLFCGLGVTTFFRTILDRTGAKVAFRRHPSIHSLRRELRNLFPACQQRQWNLIIRPVAPPRLSLVQLDDLTGSQLDRVIPFSFLALETSAGNFQSWLAVQDVDPNIVRRIKRAAGADPSASGATRLAGSFNFKSKYAPDFPRVSLKSIAPQRTVTVGELGRVGLIAHEGHQTVRIKPTNDRWASRNSGCAGGRACHALDRKAGNRPLAWPSYARCLSGAPHARNHDGKDRSAADFEFCLISIDRGWSIEETANQLIIDSEKAKALGRKYAVLTARRASSVVLRHSDASSCNRERHRLRLEAIS